MKKNANMQSEKLSFRIAMLWIFLITFFCCGSFLVAFFYYKKIRRIQFEQTQYNIVAIIQTTPDKEKLKTVFLAELFDLSVDHPTNLLRFDAREAKKKLLSLPLITSARVKKILPGMLYVDYTMRKPIAFLLDYANTVVDREGVPFPFKPFITPKKLPEIYLGIDNDKDFVLGQPIRNDKSKLALYLLDLINQHCCFEKSQLLRVDVSKALADSYGQRQIVVIMEDQIQKKTEQGFAIVVIPQILRLSVDSYRQELANYLAMKSSIIEQGMKDGVKEFTKVNRVKPVIVDLRIPQLAYITKSEE